MTVTNCPRCCEPFRVPEGEIPQDAYAKCPWCRETFPINDALRSLPPALEILSADGMPITPTSVGTAAAVGGAGLAEINQFADGDAGEVGLVPSSTSETIVDDGSTESFLFEDETVGNETVRDDELMDESWSSADSAESDFSVDFEGAATDVGETDSQAIGPMRVAPRRKKKGSGLRMAIQAVLGGLLAVPAAGGILLALGRAPDLGFWPFDGQAGTSTRVSAAPLPSSSTLEPPSPAVEFDSSSFAADPADSALEQIMTPEDPPTTTSEDSSLVMPDANLDDAESVTAAVTPADESPAFEPEPTPEPEPAPEPTPEPEPAPESNVLRDSPEMKAAADLATEQIGSFAALQGDDKARKSKLARTYEKIAMACELGTSDSDAIRGLATTIKESPVIEDIELAGSLWLGYGKRTTNGIALIGELGQGGGGPTIAVGGKSISVVGTELPQAGRVLAMGRIIDNGASVELVHIEPLP